MRRHIGRWRALANAAFALSVLGLGGFGLYQVASRRWQVQQTFHVRTRFATVSGVEAGHRVRLQGMNAGVVESVIPPRAPGEAVELVLRVDERLRHLVRTDTVARILAEGMVGARVVELTPGLPQTPLVQEGGLIASESPLELSDLIRQTAGTLQNLEELGQTTRVGLEQINGLVQGIREGRGSLGKLVQDDTLYHRLESLARHSEHAASALEENLAALKRTWPISRYFDSRAYFERERVLYQPGSTKSSRRFPTDALFEPNRAILSPVGRTRLDEVAAWCKQTSKPNSEIVIAAFCDESLTPEIAEILTQEQATSILRYLVDKHAIDSAGWFKNRLKVAAVGFGCQVPLIPEAGLSEPPSRRIEIIVFTPQT